MSQAEAQGINTDYAYVSQVTIDRFLTYAQYDRDNPDEVARAVNELWWKNKIPANYDTELPFDELQGCLEVADAAISELQSQIGGSIQLADPVDFRRGVVQQDAGGYSMNGKPVFPSTFIWMPDDEDTKTAFGRMGGIYYTLAHVMENSQGVDQNALSRNVTSLQDQNAAKRIPHDFFLGYNGAGWMQDQYPEIWDVGRYFVPFDTDSPLIRQWFTELFEGALPLLSETSGDVARIHTLANEPHFSTREGGWLASNGVSSHTMEKYKAWLESRYDNDIAVLNSAYGTTHVDFSAARDAMPVPVPTSLQGGPIWYDWCRFNMYRITDWFTFLANGTMGNDVDAAPSSIKILGGQLLDNWRDHGMDMEALVKLQGVMSSDYSTAPYDMVNINLPQEKTVWTNHYCLDWVEQSSGLDFAKSLCPEKPFYDSEWHGLNGGWQHFDMEPAYVRAALWCGFTHGLNAINAWVWGRKNDGSHSSVNSIFVGEPTTMPRAMDAYGRTLKEVNAHAEAITELVPNSRDFLVYYCEDSAIQDLTYTGSMKAVYEAMKLLNVNVGFTTPTEIAKLDSSKVVVIPPTPYISDASLNALLGFGGSIVLVDPAGSFVKDEHGKPRGASGISAYGTIGYNDVFTMADSLSVLLDSKFPTTPVPFSITTTSGQDAYGVFVNQAESESNADITISLINVSVDARTVTLDVSEEDTSLENLLTGETISNVITMQPYDVMLLKVSALNDWQLFINRFGLGGDPEADSDGDGQSDIHEYAMGGDPTNAAVGGMEIRLDYEASHQVSFYHPMRTGELSGITYMVEWATNLVTGPWVSEWNLEVAEPTVNPEINVGHKRVWGGDKPHLFFRVSIEHSFMESVPDDHLGLKIEAEHFNAQNGIQVVGDWKVGYIENGDWIRFDALEIVGASSFSASLASQTSGGTVEVRAGSVDGALLGSVTVGGTGGWNEMQVVSGAITEATGVSDIFLVFTGGSGFLMDIDYFRFD